MTRFTRRGFAAGLLAAPALIGRARADGPIRLRASLDTTPTHGRTISVGDYLKQVEAASGGRIRTELFDSGQLFADRDVIKALVQGQIELAAPGAWLVSGFVPDADLHQLPALYGQPGEVVDRVVDGRAGQLVSAQIESRLGLHVVGPWLDLGFTNWYSTRRKLGTFDDLKDLKIRNSGGVGQSWRAHFFGAIPITVAWPEVPLALSQGTFDALASTNESIASARLWESGLRYSLEDHQFDGAYVPLFSKTFWASLDDPLRALLSDTWRRNIAAYRDRMAAAQSQARKTMLAHGIEVVDPPADEIAAIRARMLKEQDQLARQDKLSPDLVRLVMADIGGAA